MPENKDYGVNRNPAAGVRSSTSETAERDDFSRLPSDWEVRGTRYVVRLAKNGLNSSVPVIVGATL